MKKLFLLFCLILFGMNIANAATTTRPSYCTPPKNVGNTVSKVFSNISGANFIATKAVETIIQNSIKKSLGSSANVEVYAFTFGALTQGKFKKMTVESKSLNLDGFYISNFKSVTECDYNHVEVSGEDILFKENFGMTFSAKITNDDLAAIMKSPKMLSKINEAKITVLGQTLIRVNYIKFAIRNNQLMIIMKVMSPTLWGITPKTVNATTDLKIENGKIHYTNIQLNNISLVDNGQYFDKLINIINPFTFDINITKNSNGYTYLKNVIIENNEIKIDGQIYIPKNI